MKEKSPLFVFSFTCEEIAIFTASPTLQHSYYLQPSQPVRFGDVSSVGTWPNFWYPYDDRRYDMILLREVKLCFGGRQVQPGTRKSNPTGSQPLIASGQH